MNKKQFQLDICKALLDGKKTVSGGRISDTEYAITANGYDCVVLSEKEIIFDVSKIRQIDMTQIFSEAENGKELAPTGKLFNESGYLMIELSAGGLLVYVNSVIYNKYKGNKMITRAPLGPIIVKDGFDRLIGVIMPMRKEGLKS